MVVGVSVGKPRRTAIANVCLALSAVAVASAHAEAPPTLSEQLVFEISGRVSARCELDQFDRRIDLGTLTDMRTGGVRATEAHTELRIDCNAPFAVSFASVNGGLAHRGRINDPSFRDIVAYSVSMDLAQGEMTRRAPCRSERMTRERPCIYSIANTGGETSVARVSVQVDADDRPLLYGRFSDQLQLRVSPLLGGEEIAQPVE